MLKPYLACLFALLFSFAVQSQNALHAQKIAVIQQVIKGYNQHDYAAMRQPWIGIAKLFVTKSKLRKEFENYHLRYGNLSIDTLISENKYVYVAKLKPSKINQPNVYLSFIFNEKAKLEGFGESYPVLAYKKKIVHTYTPQNFVEQMDSVILKKYLFSENQPFNGCLAVLDKGEIIYQKCNGFQDYSSKQSLNDTTVFELASVSKQFTALAILILEQKGLLKLSDTLQQFFPELPYSNISIENLLNHSSGLPDYETLLKKVWDKSQFAYNSDVVKLLAIHQPKALFPSGEQFEYCNTGYVLLSSIIEKVSKQSYQQFLEQHIFEPLQMKHTRVYNTRRTAKEKIENYAYGYVYSGYKNEYVLVDSLAQYNYVIYQDGITGDGTVNSCIKDLQIWEREIINPQVMSPLLFEKAFQNRTLKNGTPTNYGYGFFISGEEKLSYHTGGWPGYTSMVMNFLDQQKQIIILSNNYYTHFTRMADEMAEALLK